MRCPKCGNRCKTLETRHSYTSTRRRKECLICAHRFTTQEKIVEEVNTDEPATLPTAGLGENFSVY